MECLRGSGYVEESIMPGLYSEAPLSSIWEGCGNVISLDILRATANLIGLPKRRLAQTGGIRKDRFSMLS